MAELGFVLTKQEEEGLIRHALGRGCWLVPDVDYESPEPIRITTYEQYEGCRKSTRLFFILHPSFSGAPLEMRETIKDNRRVFFVVQRNGGPTIDFLSSVEFSEAGQAKINPGFLAHHKTYWDPRAQKNESVPAALPEFYRDLSAEAKKLTVREKVGVRVYWIGREVQRLIESRKLQLGIALQTNG